MEDEQEPVLGRKKVKAGHKKVKAGHRKVKAGNDCRRRSSKTSNKEYNDITEMLNVNNVSKEDACKKTTKIEDRLKLVEEANTHISDECKSC